MKFSLTRSGGQITGGTKDFSSLSTLQHNNQRLKALDVFDPDTVFHSMEDAEFPVMTDDAADQDVTHARPAHGVRAVVPSWRSAAVSAC